MNNTPITILAPQALTMSSLEIAELTGKRHDHVLRDARAMLVELYGDEQVQIGLPDKDMFEVFCEKMGWGISPPKLGNQRIQGVTVSRDSRGFVSEIGLDYTHSMSLISGYNVKLRKAIIDRWQRLEAQQSTPALTVPRTLPEALRLAADLAEQKDKAEAALALAAPKVEFVDRYVDATGNKGFRQVAKLLKANEARFREFLDEKKILYRLGGEWMPYQQHIDAGRFVVKTGVADSEHAYNQARFTPKGVEWIAALWAVHQLSDDADAGDSQ